MLLEDKVAIIYGAGAIGGAVARAFFPARYHQGPGQIDKLWIVDVDGELVVIDTAYYEGTPQDVRDELEAIVDSVSFD